MHKWKEIQDFPGWIVSDHGQVMNEFTNRLMRPRQNSQGVLMVGLQQEDGQKTRSVGLLVARAFVHNPMPKHFDSIIFLNGDKTDCRAMNLMWRSRPFALRYHAMFDKEPARVSVYRSDTGEFFYSLRELCTKYGLIETLALICMNNGDTVFPYNWKIEEHVN